MSWPNDYPQEIGSLARGSDGTLWAGTGEATRPARPAAQGDQLNTEIDSIKAQVPC